MTSASHSHAWSRDKYLALQVWRLMAEWVHGKVVAELREAVDGL